MFRSFFNIYLYIYNIYIYIYILKKECNVLRSFAKERNVLAFLYVLCKRTLHSFTFFAKERCVLCVLLRAFMFFAKEVCVFCALFRSLEKNEKERNFLLGLISRQKLEKRTEKKGTFFKRTGKNGTF